MKKSNEKKSFPVSSRKFLERAAGRILFPAGKNSAEVTLQEEVQILLRFTGNEVHQNCFTKRPSAACRIYDGEKNASAFTADLKTPNLEKLIPQASSLLGNPGKFSKPVPSLYGPQAYDPVNDFDSKILSLTPKILARNLAPALRTAQKSGVWLSGYYSATLRTVLISNSLGLNAFHRSSSCRIGFTLRKGNGIGYASAFSPFPGKLAFEKTFREAMEQAALSNMPVRLKPGFYPAILAPRAGAEFLSPFWIEFSGLKVGKRESFLWDKKGESCFSDLLTIDDNPFHPCQSGLPFDGEGFAKKSVSLIRRGIIKNFTYNRKTAHEFKTKPTGHSPGLIRTETVPVNPVIRPGTDSALSLLSKFRNALFIPHIWYHQIVNPDDLTATGVVKGNALVWKDGRFVGGARNCRYLNSIPKVLKNISGLSRETACIKTGPHGATVLPSLLVPDFRII